MKEFLTTIDVITRLGLQPNLVVENRSKELEKNLIRIYSFYFETDYEFDEKDYPDFQRPKPMNIRDNIITNFRNFGFYKILLDINDINNRNDVALGDSVDDLLDIIVDLLEVKWRIENNSLNDGLWYF